MIRLNRIRMAIGVALAIPALIGQTAFGGCYRGIAQLCASVNMTTCVVTKKCPPDIVSREAVGVAAQDAYRYPAVSVESGGVKSTQPMAGCWILCVVVDPCTGYATQEATCSGPAYAAPNYDSEGC